MTEVLRILVTLFLVVSLQSYQADGDKPGSYYLQHTITRITFTVREKICFRLGGWELVNWDTKHWDFLKLLGLYLAEDYTENLLQLHDAEIVRLRNYYEFTKNSLKVSRSGRGWRLFLEFEVLL